MKKTKIQKIEDLAGLLPKQSYSLSGLPMEPINLVVIGNRRFLYKHFKTHGWFRADKLGALSLTKALVTGALSLSYHEGPISGSYINKKRFAIGFEHPTKSDTFRRRHHLRLWRTPYKLMGRRVWAGTLSFDRSAGLSKTYLPTHHISPSLSWEEDFLAKSLGVSRPKHLKLSPAYKGKLNTGDDYEYDGRALVLDLSGLAGLAGSGHGGGKS